jgi:PP-loop superfamily ATP-utilizing enzyme
MAECMHRWYSRDDGVSRCYVCRADSVNVLATGTYLVIDGVVKRVDSHDYTPGLPWVGVHLEDE